MSERVARLLSVGMCALAIASGVVTMALYALALYLANAVYGVPSRGLWYLNDLLLSPFGFPFYLADFLWAGGSAAFAGALTARALPALRRLIYARDNPW